MIRVCVIMLLMVAAPLQAQLAADAYYDTEEMTKARAALKSDHGGQIHWLLLGERLEFQSMEGGDQGVWEAQAWAGGDLRKLWMKTEGEYEFEHGQFEEVELQLLYSRAVRPFWDLQAGIRYDFKPDPSRSYAVIGLQGLAPYWFELDAQLYLSDRGDVSARLEAEYEFRLTQRLLLQPRVEINAAFSADEAIGAGAGVSTIEAGLRLRYEVTRTFAPYIGLSWTGAFAQTRDFLHANSGDPEQVAWLAGVRFWY